MKQAKVFRKIQSNIYNFRLVDYSANKNYTSFIKEEKVNGFRQVIINSEIMIKIITYAVQDKSVVLKNIILNDSVDKGFHEEINLKVKEIVGNPLALLELVKNLAWTSEDGSIDIEKIGFSYEVNNNYHTITIICNGVLSGTEISHFYKEYLEPVLKDNF